MGTWGPDVDEDDVFEDVYQGYFNSYNDGAEPEGLSESIRQEFDYYFESDDDYSSALFALALASWETKTLSDQLIDEVASIIESGQDLENWKHRNAAADVVDARAKHLARFLNKLSRPRRNRKRRARDNDDYSVQVLIDLWSPDGLKRLRVERVSINGTYESTNGQVVWRWEVGGGLFGFREDNVLIGAHWNESSRLHVEISGKCHSQMLVHRLQSFADVVNVSYEAPEMTTTNRRGEVVPAAGAPEI
jgi:hypothetical protein